MKVLCVGSRGRTVGWHARAVNGTWRVLIGLAAGLPVAGAVWTFAEDVAATDGLGGIVVFLWSGPIVLAVLAGLAATVIWLPLAPAHGSSD